MPSWNSGTQCSIPGCRRPSETAWYSGSSSAPAPNSSRQPSRKRVTLAASIGTSETGRSTSASMVPVLRWVEVSNRRMLSMVSPNMSSRTGSASPAG